MTIDQAAQLTREYQQVLAEDEKRGGRRSPRALPAPKDRIITAIKLEIAHIYFIHAEMNDALVRPLINAAMFIDGFNDMPTEVGAYIESMQERRRELDSYILELLKIERSDTFFWQRIYSMLNICSETKSTSFFEGLKQKLRFGQKSEMTENNGFGGKRLVGRLTID